MRCDLEQLAAAIQAIERPPKKAFDDDARPQRAIPTTWPDVDDQLNGGLAVGRMHEWFVWSPGHHTLWFPPLHLLVHLTRQTVNDSQRPSRQCVIWIGRRCWPYGCALIGKGDRKLLQHSIFVDAPDTASRLWAIDLAMRSSAVSVVIADGSRLDMAASRRLQLAAEAGDALALVVKPSTELDMLSASTTRWLVRPAPSRDETPRWIVSLLRRKGLRPSPAKPAFQQLRWMLEYDRAQGAVRQSPHVADRSVEPAPSPSRWEPAAARLSA